MKVEEVLFTNQANPDPAQTRAIADFTKELLGMSVSKGDPELALNALLGAYMNFARMAPGVSRVKVADALNRVAQQLLDEHTKAAAPSSVLDALSAVHALMQRINAVTKGHEHNLVLSALITLFQQGALANACCTANCAQGASMVAAELAAAVIKAGPQATVH